MGGGCVCDAVHTKRCAHHALTYVDSEARNAHHLAAVSEAMCTVDECDRDGQRRRALDGASYFHAILSCTLSSSRRASSISGSPWLARKVQKASDGADQWLSAEQHRSRLHWQAADKNAHVVRHPEHQKNYRAL